MSYAPAQLASALADRTLVELQAMIRPSDDLALFRADMAGWESAVRGQQPGWRASNRDWVRAMFSGRAALLSPFDRLIHDRRRTLELFEFDYYLEMYKPAAKRRWGYFALPILYSDRLVGKLDATADRDAGLLRVNAVHQDVPFDRPMTAAVDDEIQDLADWLELDLARPGRSSP